MSLIDKVKVISVIVAGFGINISAAMLLDKFMSDNAMMIVFTLGILAVLTVITIGVFMYAITIEKYAKKDQLI